MVASWRPDLYVGVAFNADPNDATATPSWTDLTVRLRNATRVKRGRQYELDQNQASQPTMVLDDPDEYLNPGNSLSPYAPNVVPYRQLLWQAMWPNGGTGNLLNTGAQGVSYDPSFESYTAAATVSWITAVGGTTPTVGTTTPHSGSKDLTYTVASSATVQGVSLPIPCIPGRQYTASAYVRQSTASTQQISVTGVGTGSSTSSTGAYVQLTITFTATQPSHTLQVATTGTAVAGTVLVDDIQHEPGGSASAFTTSGPVIYGVWRGYVERWPASWTAAGKRGYAEISCVDAFGPLNKIQLWTELRNSILAKSPAYYWTLSEPSTSTAFADVSGNSGPSLGQVNADGGAATVTAGTTTAIAGDPSGVGVQFSGQQGETLAGLGSNLDNNAFGRFLATPIGSNTATWGASLAMVYTCPDTTIQVAAAGLVMFGVYGTQAAVFPEIAFAADFLGTGGISVSVDDASLNGPSPITTTTTFQNGTTFHLLVLTVDQSGGNQTLKIYVDGTQQATSTVNVVATYGTATPDLRCYNVEIGGECVQAGLGGPNGTYAHCAAWNRALSAAEVADMWSAFGGYLGETSGTRVSRYLSYGWTGPTAVQAGLSVMGVSNLTAGTKTLAGCQAVTTTENGDFWVDSLGDTTFASRLARYLETSSTYTFGENISGGEYPYQDGIGFDDDPTLTYDTVTVENSGGITAVASNSTTTKKFFPNAYQIQINVEDNNEAIDHATFILQQHDTPRQRVASIVLDPVGNPQLWPVVLSLEVGMRVTVVRRATAANLVMSGDYFVESISHDGIDMEAGTWLTTLLLSPVDLYQVGILNNTTFGRLGSDTAVLVSSISSSATTATVSTTGPTSPYPPPGTAFTTAVASTDCPFAVTIDTEQVTVSTVAALLSDTFGRTTSNGWGTATSGQSWTTSGGSAANFSTNGSVGQITNASVNVGRYVTTALAVADIENTIQVTVPAVATGAAMNAYWLARFADTSNHFRFQLTFNTDSTIDLKITKVVAGVSTVKATYTNFASYGAATIVNLRAKVLGTGLYANAWLSTATEKPGWMLATSEATDLTAAGGVGVLNLLTTGNTNASPVFSFDNINTVTPQTFTIVRPTDGSAASHSAGATVQALNPFILAF